MMNEVYAGGTIVRKVHVRTLGVLAALALLCQTSAGLAAAPECGSVQTLLVQRKTIASRITALGTKNIDAKKACAGFTEMVGNGASLVKWLEANKDWCQVPDSFSEGIKADHGRAVQIRAKACNVAAKQVQMEKQAKEAAPNSGLLGGNGLTGASRLPQGAL